MCDFERIISETRGKGRVDAEEQSLAETSGGSRSGAAMGGVRRIQRLIVEKSSHWQIPSVLSGNKRITSGQVRLRAD